MPSHRDHPGPAHLAHQERHLQPAVRHLAHQLRFYTAMKTALQIQQEGTGPYHLTKKDAGEAFRAARKV
ncbi:MAG: hypothetical protein ACK56F_18100, partial [bacterium]